MENAVPITTRKKRNKMLRILSAKKLNAFYQQHLGQKRSVLFESENKDGFIHGFTDNYIKVKTNYNSDLINQIRSVKLSEMDMEASIIASFEDAVYAQTAL